MEFTPEERDTMQRAATHDLLVGLDRGTLPETLAVDMVLLHGADPHATRAETGLTALHLAAGTGMVRLVGVLLDAGADVNAISPGGTTPLGVLVLNHLEAKTVTPASRLIVRRLVTAGARWQEVPMVARTTPIGRAVRQVIGLANGLEADPRSH